MSPDTQRKIGKRNQDQNTAIILLEEIVKELEKIQQLCESPHWTSDRRWRIADIAQAAIKKAKR